MFVNESAGITALSVTYICRVVGVKGRKDKIRFPLDKSPAGAAALSRNETLKFA